MEVMNSNDKRTVLLVSDGVNDLSELRTLLEEKYRVAMADNKARDFAKVKETAGNISASIICAGDAAADDFSLFKWLKRDSILAAIPMLIYCGSDADLPAAGECLKRGSVDIIMPPLHKDIILNRIENAIRLKDSATFYEIERMLKELPSLIYLKDEKGRCVFSTLNTLTDPIRQCIEQADKRMYEDKKAQKKGMV